MRVRLLLLLLLAAGVASHGPKSMRERQNSSRVGNQNGELWCHIPHYTKTFSSRRRAVSQPMLERLDAIYAIGAVVSAVRVLSAPLQRPRTRTVVVRLQTIHRQRDEVLLLGARLATTSTPLARRPLRHHHLHLHRHHHIGYIYNENRKTAVIMEHMRECYNVYKTICKPRKVVRPYTPPLRVVL